MNSEKAATTSALSIRQPLSPSERRVLGVLIEKAKTTPDAYPLSLNAIRTGCNQKSSRAPVMDLDEDAVQEAVDGLREKGAAIEVQGGGRVPRYRHMGYEWLGVDKREIAVMAELLLRGPRTVGELRSHVARMADIADLAALQPLLDSLRARQLLIFLTPEGRGQVVTHTLYPPEELKRVQRDHGSAGGSPQPTPTPQPSAARAAASAPAKPAAASSEVSTPQRVARSTVVDAASSPAAQQFASLRDELAAAKSEIARLRQDLDSLQAALKQQIDDFQRFQEELGG